GEPARATRGVACQAVAGEPIGAPASSSPAPGLRLRADSVRTTARDGTADRRAARLPPQRRPTHGRRRGALAAGPSESGPGGVDTDHVSGKTVYSLSQVQPTPHKATFTISDLHSCDETAPDCCPI